MRRLEHALQRRLGNLRKGRADFRLFRRRYPLGLDGWNAGLADAAQQRLTKIVVLYDGGGVVVEATTHFFGMGPASKHMRGAHAHEFIAGISHLQRSYLGLGGACQNERGNDRCRTNSEKHYLALSAVFLGYRSCAQLAATTIAAEVTIGEPL